MKYMKCLILVGGFGTRLYPLTANRAKALLGYKGRSLLSHFIDRIPQDMDILVSTNKKFETDFSDWQ
ncbi:sugar phosphate nucleotidyltransferase [Chloroflexota bacterium]